MDKKIIIFGSYNLSTANACNLDQSRILSFVKHYFSYLTAISTPIHTLLKFPLAALQTLISVPPKPLTVSQTNPHLLTYLQYKSFENTLGKGEIVFPTLSENFSPFRRSIQICHLPSLSISTSLNVCILGKLSHSGYISRNSSNIIKVINPLPEDKILNWSKLKQIADDILVHLK